MRRGFFLLLLLFLWITNPHFNKIEKLLFQLVVSLGQRNFYGQRQNKRNSKNVT